MGNDLRSRNPVYRWRPGADRRWLVLCDHASNRVPAEFGNLGLDAAELERHIGWDIGAAMVARCLARYLRAPMIEHRSSRLLIDPNRGIHDPSLIPVSSDGTPIPGNLDLSAAARQDRICRFHQPYHRRIDRHLNQMQAAGITPTLVSVHSFTPQLRNPTSAAPRDRLIGVLWAQDREFAERMIEALGRDGTRVGNNEPYDARLLSGDSIDRHGAGRKLPHTTIELRQDQLATPAQCARWAWRVYRALKRVAGSV